MLLPPRYPCMPLLQAFGLGVAIIVLKLLTPLIFQEIETTAILFLKGAQTGASVATQIAGAAGSAGVMQQSPLVLPKAPQVRGR